MKPSDCRRRRGGYRPAPRFVQRSAALIAVVGMQVAGAAAAAAETAHGNGLPQLNPAFFLTQLFWLALIFGTFYLLVQGIGVPAIVRVLETRDAKISLELSRAQDCRNEALAVTATIEQILFRARDHARTVTQLSQHELDEIATVKTALVDAKIEARVRGAEMRIANARDKALQDIPEVATTLARSVVGHLSEVPADEGRLTAIVGEVARDVVAKDRVH